MRLLITPHSLRFPYNVRLYSKFTYFGGQDESIKVVLFKVLWLCGIFGRPVTIFLALALLFTRLARVQSIGDKFSFWILLPGLTNHILYIVVGFCLGYNHVLYCSNMLATTTISYGMI